MPATSDHQPQLSIHEDEDPLGAVPLTQTMVPNAFGAVWCYADSGCYQADQFAGELLGIPDSGSLDHPTIRSVLAEVTPIPGGQQRYFTFRSPAGRVSRARLVPSPPGHCVILVDDLQTITSRVFSLRASEREFRELYENATYGIYRTSIEGTIQRANPALVRLQGCENEAEFLELVNSPENKCYVDPNRRRAFREAMLRHGRVVDFVSEVRRHRSSERFWITETAWMVRDEAGNCRYIAGTVVDVTERVNTLERLRAAAETDALTGLANRAAFYAEMERRIVPGSPPMTLYLVDCDRFKDINDVYGHARGDAVLQICADRLRAAAPAGSVIARLGGDEFAVQITGQAEDPDIMAVADRIAAVFEMPIEIRGATHLLGASIGISRFPDHGTTMTDLMRNADLALYAVKERGRGHSRLFDAALDHVKQHRHAMALDLRGAPERGELQLYYQPIVEGHSRRMVGVEALIRWNHATRGLMRPADFIPVAEEAGLMLPFGEWAIQEACRHAAVLPESMSVAVNVSAVQFRSSDLSDVVAAALAASGINPQRLELEVTESVVLKNESATFRVLEKLKALGVRLALDDFGTGYSSLSYLQRFAFDKVKIDRSFVHSIKTNAVNRAVARAVLSIGRDLGLAVVAEGIETDTERQTLLNEGCTLQQGYLYGEPVPFEEMVTRVALADLQPLRLALPSQVHTALGKAV